jgi:hypothetical protein
MLKNRLGLPGNSKWLVSVLSLQLSSSLAWAPLAIADDAAASDSKSTSSASGSRMSAIGSRFRGFVRHRLTRDAASDAVADDIATAAPAFESMETVESSSNDAAESNTKSTTETEKVKVQSETKNDAGHNDALKSAEVESAPAAAKTGQSTAVPSEAAKSAEKPETTESAGTPKAAETEKPTESAETSKTVDSATSDERSKSGSASTEKNSSGPAKSEPGKSGAVALIPGEVHTEATKTEDGPLMIDNDEAAEVKQTIEYKELPTDEGGTKVKAGATFPVVISSQITSKSANTGDAIEARLKYDLKIGERLVAEQGSSVIGHINYVLKARSTMKSMLSLERWYRNSGCLGITFDEIVNSKGEHIPLVAAPAQQARIVKNKNEGRELGVNHNGQVTGPLSQQLRYKAIRIGLNAAMAPAGAFSFGAMPIALGCIGAANPSFAFMKPVGQNVRHRRIKGFVWGALSGVPGSWVVEDTVIKGQEAIIKPGDEFLAEFKEEFTGEPETEASLIPGASTKVRGQVVPGKKGKKS